MITRTAHDLRQKAHDCLRMTNRYEGIALAQSLRNTAAIVDELAQTTALLALALMIELRNSGKPAPTDLNDIAQQALCRAGFAPTIEPKGKP